jgi:hypothetical protein
MPEADQPREQQEQQEQQEKIEDSSDQDETRDSNPGVERGASLYTCLCEAGSLNCVAGVRAWPERR